MPLAVKFYNRVSVASLLFLKKFMGVCTDFCYNKIRSCGRLAGLEDDCRRVSAGDAVNYSWWRARSIA